MKRPTNITSKPRRQHAQARVYIGIHRLERRCICDHIRSMTLCTQHPASSTSSNVNHADCKGTIYQHWHVDRLSIASEILARERTRNVLKKRAGMRQLQRMPSFGSCVPFHYSTKHSRHVIRLRFHMSIPWDCPTDLTSGYCTVYLSDILQARLTTHVQVPQLEEACPNSKCSYDHIHFTNSPCAPGVVQPISSI